MLIADARARACVLQHVHMISTSMVHMYDQYVRLTPPSKNNKIYEMNKDIIRHMLIRLMYMQMVFIHSGL